MFSLTVIVIKKVYKVNIKPSTRLIISLIKLHVIDLDLAADIATTLLALVRHKTEGEVSTLGMRTIVYIV